MTPWITELGLMKLELQAEKLGFLYGGGASTNEAIQGLNYCQTTSRQQTKAGEIYQVHYHVLFTPSDILIAPENMKKKANGGFS